MRSIRTKILVYVLSVVVVSFVVIGIISYFEVSKNVMGVTLDLTSQINKAVSGDIDETIHGLMNRIESIAKTIRVRSMDWEEAKGALHDLSDSESAFEGGFLSWPDGRTETTTNKTVDISNRDYYKVIFEQGAPYAISEAVISLGTQKPAFVIAFPVIKDGQRVGLVGFNVSLERFSELVSSFKPLGHGYVVIVDNTGTVVTHPNANYIMKLKLSEADSQGFKGLSAVGSAVLSGKEGVADVYDPNGNKLKVFYAPLEYAQGWSTMVVIPASVVNGMASKSVIPVIITIVIALILVSLIIFYVASRTTKPLVAITSSVERFGQGNLDVSFEVKTQDEIGRIAAACKDAVDKLRQVIAEAFNISAKNKDASENMASATQEITASLQNINSSMQEIYSLAENNSAAIEETSAGIEEVASGAQSAAKSAVDAAEAARNAINAVEAANEQMTGCTKQLEVVRDMSSDSVNKTDHLVSSLHSITDFVNVITGIADQTNLLALNAAIEAARAGEHGRGFAVVAEEVRKLAEQSSKAAQEIKGLMSDLDVNATATATTIKETVDTTMKVINAVEVTQKTLENATAQVTKINDSIQSLASIAEEQSASTQEMASATNQIAKDATRMAELVEDMRTALEEIGKTAETIARDAVGLDEGARKLEEVLSYFRAANTQGVQRAALKPLN
ncbi:methyl-accepting chemotaxis protein [Acetomicrobium hydrogeniformans]|uniref:Methyl-accepting chemotaxis protein signaling domain protein n=1 Tax=Acetomicrobium hydrogeniformans ATCC BAA-1850 TaxID=592015 RepID=A0A0T5XDM6_9BACT|nr:methyl-accepting chemotaxis protein [Acetomicrobium hydrogeniformans]KRT36460.1 methyl-accepting chemotaxis protein signaling domain protein [Acetomicrobium hydrogeniformans ATCC BAA-1850]